MSEPPVQPDFRREHALIVAGARHVAGVDEAGRGPLAGPVVAACVVLDPLDIPPGLRDSKALGAAARESLAALIRLRARAVGIGSASAAEIDAIDIRKATLLAMRRAVCALPFVPCHVLVDGRDLPAIACPGTTVVKGDRDVLSIAAASIIAKVTRDRMMARLAETYSAYGFERHAGYGTVAHRAAIARFGPCPVHRISFGSVAG